MADAVIGVAVRIVDGRTVVVGDAHQPPGGVVGVGPEGRSSARAREQREWAYDNGSAIPITVVFHSSKP